MPRVARAERRQTGLSKSDREHLIRGRRERLSPVTLAGHLQYLKRYERYLALHHEVDLETARWEHIVAYRAHLLGSGMGYDNVQRQLRGIERFYELRWLESGSLEDRAMGEKTQALARGLRRCKGEVRTEPYSLRALKRIIRASRSYEWLHVGHGKRFRSEDYVVVTTLLYTGGRAQVYGLRVRDIDFRTGCLSVPRKGGGHTQIPLHPTLERVLKEHLATRDYRSPFVFRNGRDGKTVNDIQANKDNATHCCERVQRAAGLRENIHPQRFRVTLATYGRELGLETAQIQGILGHTNPLTTMKYYSRPRIEELKREFARIDLLRPRATPPKATVGQIMAALRRLAPEGKEEAWCTLVQGFAELFAGAGRADESSASFALWSAHGRYTRG